jgi:hypothetical protein
MPRVRSVTATCWDSAFVRVSTKISRSGTGGDAVRSTSISSAIAFVSAGRTWRRRSFEATTSSLASSAGPTASKVIGVPEMLSASRPGTASRNRARSSKKGSRAPSSKMAFVAASTAGVERKLRSSASVGPAPPMIVARASWYVVTSAPRNP